MLKNHIRLGRIAGIPIQIDVSWLLIFVFVTWSLGGSYFPGRYPNWSRALSWGMGAVTSVLFFGSVLLHELGHSLVARAQGLPVHDITLFIFGGVSQLSDEPNTPKHEALMAGVGPLVSLALAALFGVLYWATRHWLEPVAALGLYLAGINLSLAIFNLIPGFPLDGGRVLRAVLWGVRHDLTWATRIASAVGQAVAYLFILLGIFMAFAGNVANGVWIAFIGLFLDNAARSSYLQLTLRNMLTGHVVSEIMSRDCTSVPLNLTLDVVVEHYLVGNAHRCLTVVGPHGDVAGLLTVHGLHEVPKERWRDTRVSDVVLPMDKLHSVRPDTPLMDALQKLTETGVNQLPVLVDGHLEGMLTRENLLSFIRTRTDLGS